MSLGYHQNFLQHRGECELTFICSFVRNNVINICFSLLQIKSTDKYTKRICEQCTTKVQAFSWHKRVVETAQSLFADRIQMAEQVISCCLKLFYVTLVSNLLSSKKTFLLAYLVSCDVLKLISYSQVRTAHITTPKMQIKWIKIKVVIAQKTQYHNKMKFVGTITHVTLHSIFGDAKPFWWIRITLCQFQTALIPYQSIFNEDFC